MERRTPWLFLLLFVLFGFHPNAAGLTRNAAPPKAAPSKNSFLSQSEVSGGLREALVVGAKNAINLASRVDGFYKNPEIFIPFPPEANKMKAVLERVGLKSQVQRFVMTLNRAAEEAAKQAAPIFLGAIKELTIEDAFSILKGSNDAATAYLRSKTSGRLTAAFRPVVQRAISKVELTKVWNPLVTQYDQIPFVPRVNPDLDDYVTERAVSGLFKLIADEERKIRQNPAARVTDILRRVFGS